MYTEDPAGVDEGFDAETHTASCLSSLCTLKVRQRPADQKLMALPKEAARFASLKASDTVG